MQLYSQDTTRATRTRLRITIPVVGLALLASACTASKSSSRTSAPATSGSSTTPGATGGGPASSVPASSAPASSSAVAEPVRLAATPASGTGVNPAEPITVTATHGTLSAVTLLTPAGKAVKGALSADRTSWHTTEDLGYSRSYRLTATGAGTGAAGAGTLSKTFTTLTPSNLTQPYLNTIYGSSLKNGATYGVGMIPVVHFDEQIADRKAAEKALAVTTSPHVDGSWYWLDDSNVHWRPQSYYRPGTVVTVAANVYGVNVGNHMYGQSDQKVSFTIGARHIAVADAKSHRVKVYFDGTLVKNMPTSMGRGGTVAGKNGQTIYLWTMPGTYTVIGHENPATMSSDSYGLPANSPLGYAPEKVPYATKISTDGIYLHELETTVSQQGHSNVSHGCLNLNQANAKWYYETSRVGDIVKVINSGGPIIQPWQGGDWTVSWKDWLKGSAL